MGRLLLIGLFAGALASCGSPEGPADGHVDVTCEECHTGPSADREIGSVPAEACLACHEDAGPGEVEIASVLFEHREHAAGSDIEPTCAGCHTHEEGAEPLVATVDACALCHVGEVQTAEAAECRECHVQPDHTQLTSQGVAISHSELPWLDIGCVRCHYDVAEAETEVSQLTCRECHDDMAVLEQAAGEDPHPVHGGLACTSCHASDLHQVRAMSSAVDLVCSDCHIQAHEVQVRLENWPPSEVCSECHQAIHEPQQRLILGVVPVTDVRPSEKFLAGITCRSCHIPPSAAQLAAAEVMEPIRGQATACAGCHEQEYEQVLDWWLDGLDTRVSVTGRYVDRARAQVAASSDDAASLIEEAAGMVALVSEAGGQHNLELSDRLMREAVERVRRAYGLAGLQPPPSPDFGRTPHAGLCSYCHYDPSEPWDFEAMPEDFHQGLVEQ